MCAAGECEDPCESHVSNLARKITDITVALTAKLRDTIDHGPQRDTARRARVELDGVDQEHRIACGIQTEGEARNVAHDTMFKALDSLGSGDLLDVLCVTLCRAESEQQDDERDDHDESGH